MGSWPGTQLIGAGARTALRLPASGRAAEGAVGATLARGPSRLVTWGWVLGMLGPWHVLRACPCAGGAPRWLVGVSDSVEPPCLGRRGQGVALLRGKWGQASGHRGGWWAASAAAGRHAGHCRVSELLLGTPPRRWPQVCSSSEGSGRSLCPVLLQLCCWMGTRRGGRANVWLPFPRPHITPSRSALQGKAPLPPSLPWKQDPTAASLAREVSTPDQTRDTSLPSGSVGPCGGLLPAGRHCS